ncbi:hypothetical protein ACOMICROBIO_NCLOACGD_00348 [Vibrio sp. B1ASS3]|nr:hypothetical protein ACOMICROBIO_NCLOACGD_00348 [Vibrio sp. B1ASS3]CAE6882144.1 hypothetical protein ACOMICROBIO_NCLOACGD_00348 [Vibrio sp. B1ASS3]
MTNEHAEYTLTLEHLWQFSLQFYGVREVKEACLSLQNNYHGNVNLLLLLRWLDEQQVISKSKTGTWCKAVLVEAKPSSTLTANFVATSKRKSTTHFIVKHCSSNCSSKSSSNQT